MPHAILEA